MKQGIKQVVNLIGNNTYTVSAYLRRPSGATAPRVVVTLITGGTEYEEYTLASAAQLNAQTAGVWVRYDVQVTPAADRNKLSITADGAAGTKIDIAAPQLERGNQKTAYLATNQYTTSGKVISGGTAAYLFEAGSANNLLRPTSDISAGGWLPSAGSDLYAMISETVRSDADYIYTGTPSVCEVRFTAGAATIAGTTTIKYALIGNQTVYLVNGTTVIASWVHNPGPGSVTLYEQTVQNATSAADLRLRFEAH